ncbi:MAG: OmpA family protein [Reichenbachiella sp.]
MIHFSKVLFALLIGVLSAYQVKSQEGNLIRVTGTVTHPETSQPISANVFYEKLPYYDDMGTASTDKKNGVYELFMLENTKYIINVKADGYKPISQEITIVDTGAGIIEKNFKMEPDGLNEVITLENLMFARGKAEINEVSHQELDEFVIWLKDRPNAVVQLEGHTDFQGNADANMNLSEQRVVAVKDYLVRKGIKKQRIKTKAFGGTQPLTRERTPEARTKNRRVEVRILEQ